MMPASRRDSEWRPVVESERFTVLDLVRGLALFGVLLVNLLYFFRVSLFDHILRFHSHPGLLNHAVDYVVAELIEFKAFDLFSLTFGIGIGIQAERAMRNGVGAELFLLRRLSILLAFGLAHLLLISNVDILCLYAVCGLLLIPLLRLPAAVLAIVGIAAIYLPPVVSIGPPFPPEAALRAHIAAANRIYSGGSTLAIIEFRWHETATLILPLLVLTAQRVFGLMLVGVAMWRSGIIREPGRHRVLLRFVCAAAAVVGLVNTTVEVVEQSGGDRVAIWPVFQALGSHVPLAFAYGSAALIWRRSPASARVMAPFAAAGRMTLTNYLGQSIVLGAVFYGYGFGLFGRLDPAATAAGGIVFYALQLAVSAWWLRRYRFGPFEWLWRSLTYGRSQPMRIRKVSDLHLDLAS